MMNGASLFTAATSNTSSVTLSWTAPTGGFTPAGYEIYFSCWNSCPDTSQSWGYVYTSSTSITLPPGLLASGYDYVFDIAAIADSRANYNNAPNRSGYPQAYADVVSADLTIAGGIDAVNGHSAVSKAANKNVVHTKRGSFLVTPKGNKPLDVKAKMMARFGQRPTKASTGRIVTK
jgi:hypothetical protein